jgi:hypothetical protein
MTLRNRGEPAGFSELMAPFIARAVRRAATVGAVDDDPLLAPMPGAVHQEFAGMQIDVESIGEARVKRLVYPPGGRWSEHVKPVVGTDWCEHAHVGFLARGHFVGRYADGDSFDYVAPCAVTVEPGHDSWVEGDEPVVLIQFDFERDTVARLGLRTHRST